jgi:LysM repeat protein
MKEIRLLSALLGLSIALVSLAGCTLPFAPDIEPTLPPAQVVDAGMATTEATVFFGATVEADQPPPSSLTSELSPLPTPEPTAPAATPTATAPAVELTIVIPTAAVGTVEFAPTAAPALATGLDYIVQPGDTLYSIARRYGMRYEDLAAYNGIINAHQIWVGQEIHIPAGSSTTTTTSTGDILYTVRLGDNLFRIALRYNVSYMYLASYNGISNPHLIRAGQVIHIPAAQ